jgi:transposase-like protein
MSKTQRRKRGGRPDGLGGRGASVAIEMERLRRRFELFRGGHDPGSRIPDELRAAALAAQDRGASEGDLRRACQATSVQLRQWRAQLRRGAPAGAPAEPAARVFDVIDDQAALESTPIVEPSSRELELRLGGWAVRISQLGG